MTTTNMKPSFAKLRQGIAMVLLTSALGALVPPVMALESPSALMRPEPMPAEQGVSRRLPYIGTSRPSRTGGLYEDNYRSAGLTFYQYGVDYHGALGAMTAQQRGAIDFALPRGTPVIATRNGTVTSQTSSCQVVIDYGGGVLGYYIHVQNVIVTPGQQVTQGQQIAEVGQAGSCGGIGEHLHYAEWAGGREIELTFSNAPTQTSNGYTCPAGLICPGKSGYVSFAYTGSSSAPPPAPPPAPAPQTSTAVITEVYHDSANLMWARVSGSTPDGYRFRVCRLGSCNEFNSSIIGPLTGTDMPFKMGSVATMYSTWYQINVRSRSVSGWQFSAGCLVNRDSQPYSCSATWFAAGGPYADSGPAPTATQPPIPTLTPTATATLTPAPAPSATATPTATATSIPVPQEMRVVATANPATIRVGQTSAITLTLRDPVGVGVNAMEIQCDLEPALQGRTVTPRNLFSPDPAIINPGFTTGGQLSFAVSQTGDNPGVTAEGAILDATVAGMGSGQATLACNVIALIGPADEAVAVPYVPITVTVEESSPNDGAVIGAVLLSPDRGDRSGTIVSLLGSGGAVVAEVPTQADGTFTAAAPEGVYTIHADRPGYLSGEGTVTVIAGQTAVEPALTLPFGDVHPDNVVDELDVVELAVLGYGDSVPPAPAILDANGDSLVSLPDLRALAIHLRQTGPLAWQ